MSQDKVFICYETTNGTDINLHCKEVQLSNQSVSDALIISDHPHDQKNPDIQTLKNLFGYKIHYKNQYHR